MRIDETAQQRSDRRGVPLIRAAPLTASAVNPTEPASSNSHIHPFPVVGEDMINNDALVAALGMDVPPQSTATDSW
jgi:hypothetical protein